MLLMIKIATRLIHKDRKKLMKISRNIHITFIISTLLIFTSVSNASLINPNLISAGVGMSTQSTQFDGESQQSTINAMFNPISPNTITASHENKRANTGIGFMNGGGYSDWDKAGKKINDATPHSIISLFLH